MGTGPQRKKRNYRGDHPIKEKYRTKRKTKDLDEIQADMGPSKVCLKDETDQAHFFRRCVYARGVLRFHIKLTGRVITSMQC